MANFQSGEVEPFSIDFAALARAAGDGIVTRYGADVLRVPALHKDGRSLSIAFTVCLLTGPAGKPAAIAGFVRDETARWQEERALRRRVAEREGKAP